MACPPEPKRSADSSAAGRWLGLAVLLGGALLGTSAGSPAQRPASPLTAGSALTRAIGPGERHAHPVRGGAGDFLHAEIEPAGADVALTVLDPAGAPLLDLDDPTTPFASETLFLLLPAAGEVRLVVRAVDGPRPGAGSYRLRVVELRPADEADRARAAALAISARGFAAAREETAEAAHRIVDLFTEAAPLWREAGDAGGEAMSLNFVGRAAARQGENERAVAAFQQAISVARGAGLELWEARTRQNLGALHGSLGDAKGAQAEHLRALPVLRRLGQPLEAAVALNDLGMTYTELGDGERALELLGEAAAAARAAGSPALEATALHNLGGVYAAREDYWRALEIYRRALPMTEAAGNRQEVAATLNQIAWVFDMLGEKERALDTYRQVLQILREVGARQWEAVALHNVGGAHLALGDLPHAREAYLEALALSREMGDRRGEASRLSSLGQACAAMGDAARARQHFVEALAIRREAEDRLGSALTLRHLARLDAEAGRGEEAREAFLEVLGTARALEISGLEAAAYDGLAGLALEWGDLPGALAAAETAVALGESLRARVPGDDLRTAYFSSLAAYHKRAIEVLMAWHRREPGRGHGERALALSESARARTLLDAVTDPARRRSSPDRGLVERAASARRDLSAAAFRLYQLARDSPAGARVAAQEARVRALLAGYKEAEARAQADRWRAGAPAALDDAWRREALDDDTLLLEVSLGREASYLWAVDRTGVESYVLPPGEELEATARRLHDLATERDRPHPSAAEGQFAADAADRRFAHEAAAFSRGLLGPVAELARARRLVLVLEGALNLVPFAALPLPEAGGTTDAAAPLASRYEVVSLPSASLLTELRARRPAPPGGPTLAIFADPVFGADDPRLAVAQARSDGAAGDPEVVRAASEAGLVATGGLPRLPYTRREASALARLVQSGEAWVALGFDATREQVAAPQVTGARLLHFATHSLANGAHPQLSGIVLSLVDEQGRERDGFLRLADLTSLDLSADLVVLSACQTAVGKTVAGEGVLSLARGFLEAGAGGVVASLWAVDEVATARFMERFYQGLLGEGLSPAGALRQAQLALAREARWRSPHYWAAFVLQGDWR